MSFSLLKGFRGLSAPIQFWLVGSTASCVLLFGAFVTKIQLDARAQFGIFLGGGLSGYLCYELYKYREEEQEELQAQIEMAQTVPGMTRSPAQPLAQHLANHALQLRPGQDTPALIALLSGGSTLVHSLDPSFQQDAVESQSQATPPKKPRVAVKQQPFEYADPMSGFAFQQEPDLAAEQEEQAYVSLRQQQTDSSPASAAPLHQPSTAYVPTSGSVEHYPPATSAWDELDDVCSTPAPQPTSAQAVAASSDRGRTPPDFAGITL